MLLATTSFMHNICAIAAEIRRRSSPSIPTSVSSLEPGEGEEWHTQSIPKDFELRADAAPGSCTGLIVAGLGRFKSKEFFPKPIKERINPQPLHLDYSRYEKILEAQKKIAEKQGSKDIEWRTATNDIMVDFRLLRDYETWAYEAEEEACGKGTPKEMEFFSDVWENLTEGHARRL